MGGGGQSIKYIHVQSLHDVKAFITLAHSEVAIVTGLLPAQSFMRATIVGMSEVPFIPGVIEFDVRLAGFRVNACTMSQSNLQKYKSMAGLSLDNRDE